MTPLEISIVALAGFLSGIIKNGVGVGGGIFLLPTLSLAFPAKVALGLGAPLMLASDIVGMRYYWKQWAPKGELVRLLCAAVPGLLIGTFLLPVIPAKVFRICVGLFGMAYAVCNLWPAASPGPFLRRMLTGSDSQAGRAGIYAYGAMGGVATVLAHAGGLVWSLYLMATLKDRRTFVGSIVLMFFFTNIYKVIAYIYIDMLSVSSLVSILPALPAVWVGGAIGNAANKKMNHELFRRIVLVVIFIVSVNLCL